MSRFDTAFNYANVMIFGLITAAPSGALWLTMLVASQTISFWAYVVTFAIGTAIAVGYALWQGSTPEPTEDPQSEFPLISNPLHEEEVK